MKTAFRNLIKYKTFSTINIFGLSIGMVCFILIMSWVQDELSYDRFHKNADNIFRIGLKGNVNGNDILSSTTPGKWGPALKENFPEIINFTRYNRQEKRLFKYNHKSFYENGCAVVDASFFEMFDFPFLKGDPRTALSDPFNMVITENIAKKYFGDEDPLHKTILFGDKAFVITGVMKNVPHNSHLQFDFLCSINLLEKIPGRTIIDWYSDNFLTYLLIEKNVNIDLLDEKIGAFIIEKAPIFKEMHLSTFIQPFIDIYLNPRVETSFGVTGDIRYVYVFTLIAFFILLIACINYMNLTTALSTVRNKEIGIRKVIGSSQKQLILQFMTESFVMSFVSFIVAVLLVGLLLPTFNQLAGKDIQFNFLNPHQLLELIIVITGTGLVAGGYPAFYRSIINPVATLKATEFSRAKGKNLRRALVITQFVISIILIIETVCIYKQVDFMKSKELGFNKTNILYIPASGEIGKRYEVIKNELLKNPNIADITSKNCPLTYSNDASIVVKEGQDVKDAVFMQFPKIDYNYIEFMGLKLITGRNFSKIFSTDVSNACIMNEEAMRLLGLKNEIGTVIHTGQNETRTIVGILKNAHFGSLKNQTEPRLYRPMTNLASSNESIILIKVKEYPAKEQRKIYVEVLSSIKHLWDTVNPDVPFEYYFLDATYDQLYKAEERMNSIFFTFTLVTILLCCLGLSGLASFMTLNRTKEIGIRKTLGASISTILFMLSKNFVHWIIVANVIAWPFAWYIVNKWLQNFAFRIDLTIWPFLLAGLLAMFIALLTVSWQAIRAARTNPVESLRYE